MMFDWLVVGQIVRPHGLRGEVVVEVTTDDPAARFAAGSQLATGTGNSLRIEAVRPHQGRLIIDAGVAAFNGVELPPHIVAPTIAITAETLGDYYTQEGDSYSPNFEAISQISVEGEK